MTGDERGHTGKPISAAGKAAAERARRRRAAAKRAQRPEGLRPEGEDDDGYDPYPDYIDALSRSDAEEPQADPWR